MIYLVRHGEDDESYIGGYSDVDLTEKGIMQISDLAKYLKNQNYNITKIYSSTIKRARTTTKIINKELDLEIVYTDNLRELDKGIYTGRKKELLTEEEKEFIKDIDIYTRFPKGESMCDLYKRVKEYLLILKEDNILLITHRGFINMIYYILNEIPLDMDKEKFGVEHGSLHELNLENKKIRKIR